MKSNRKRKSCMSSTLNVGINDKVTNHCPPDMNESIKFSLEEEIKNFDAAQARRDAETSATGGPSTDAYHSWLMQNDGHEPAEANPDIVSEEEGLKYLHSNKDNKLVSLLNEFRQLLTSRERQVWNLVMKHQYSHREAAKLLEIKPRVLDVYLKRSKEKFNKFMEIIKHVKQG